MNRKNQLEAIKKALEEDQRDSNKEHYDAVLERAIKLKKGRKI